MNKNIPVILLFMLAGANLGAQVLVNRPLVFTSSGDSARIEQLFTPLDSTAGLNAKTVQSNRFLYATASGIDSLIIALNSSIQSPNTGMIVYVKCPSSNNDSVYLSINGGGTYYPLLKKGQSTLLKNDILPGQIVVAAFDGTCFQYLNFEEKNCPIGFVAVTDEYCIEQNESVVPVNFWTSVTDCYDKGARLCNWGEWYYACQKTGLGLTNMINNWEFIDDAGNEVNMVRLAGNGTCQSAGLQNIPVNGPKNYRCCYSRK